MADLSQLNLRELRELQDQVAIEIETQKKNEVSKAREKINEIARSVGIPLTELLEVEKKIRKSSGPVAPRYRDKLDAGRTWSGRGRQPQWIKEWVDSGKSLDELSV